MVCSCYDLMNLLLVPAVTTNFIIDINHLIVRQLSPKGYSPCHIAGLSLVHGRQCQLGPLTPVSVFKR